MKKYLQNQSGAALILVLFMVLFLAITGAMLLNTTTYSQKSIIKNAEIQSEFYRAEGAIDLMLYEMNNFVETPSTQILRYVGGPKNGEPYIRDGVELPIIRSGPYYYLELGEPTIREYTIGDKIVEVTIIDIEHELIPSENQKMYNYTLVANLKPLEASTITREVTMTTIVDNNSEYVSIIQPGEDGYIVPGSGFPGNPFERLIFISDSKTNRTAWGDLTSPANSGVTFQSFLDYYNLEQLRIDTAPDYSDASRVAQVGNSIRYFDDITVSGKDVDVEIPLGHLTYANSVSLSGCGSDGSVTINGVLIAKEVTFSGNCNYYLAGGIIANSFSQEGNPTPHLSGDGFTDDGSSGGYSVPATDPVYGTVSDNYNHWSSTVSEFVNYETKR